MEGIVVVDVAHSLITAVRAAIPNITLATQTAAATVSAKVSAMATEMFASVFVRLNYMTVSVSGADNSKLGDRTHRKSIYLSEVQTYGE
jgi:hypothetical protein